MIPKLMWPLIVVMNTPFAADVVQMPLSHDHEFVETFVFQALDESLHVRSQVW